MAVLEDLESEIIQKVLIYDSIISRNASFLTNVSIFKFKPILLKYPHLQNPYFFLNIISKKILKIKFLYINTNFF